MEREWKANTGYISLFQRSVQTLLLARKISRTVKKLEKELQDTPWIDEEERQARWAALHRENARVTHRHILRYRGFLTKVGQAASIKTGELPPAWVEELRGLQDELPISSLREVRQTIRADLGRPLEQIFRDFSERPIASASVAQAHVAHLSASGQRVCVKVQHRGVASMVGTDLATVEFICKRAAKYHPDAPDATDLIKEWRRASREEVDFKIEAMNASHASTALERSGLNIGCVRPLPEYCGRRVLTMAFIDGWKITDVERLPPGTDREALARPLVDAFALLVFQEGLIHGDPHPGNVFVEQLPNGRLRAALLDWGIVQRMTPKERVSAARWVVATLSQDRVEYARSLVELGFEFDAYADQDSSAFLGFLEASMGSSAWMFRDSIPSGAQLHILAQMQKQHEQQEKADASSERPRQDAGFTKVLSKIPGVVLFFLRGLEMLQNICGSLDVPLPFSEIVLARALPLLQVSGAAASVPRPLPGPPDCPAVELAVRAKLQELEDAGDIIGAQVSVLACGPGGDPRWECRVACGRSDVTGRALTERMPVPLLENSLSVLLFCLFSAFQRPTVTGKKLSFDSLVAQTWPDFSQREKGNVTIGQLLRHGAGLARCFPAELSLKGFYTEGRIEQAVAAAPRDRAAEAAAAEEGGAAVPCRAIGIAVAALLRRSSGHARVAQAVAAALKPTGLQNDISYTRESGLGARVGRKPQTSLPVERVYEWLEDKASALESQGSAASSRWLTWQELHRERPAITDPLLVNRDILLSGEACLPGRGLRATAEAMCRLFASDLVPPDIIDASVQDGGSLIASSHQDWRDIGSPMELGAGGWRLFRVRRANSGADSSHAVGFGTVDGATGSVVLRLPEHSIAILLTSADKTTRQVGPALLTTVLGSLGWEPMWQQDPPPDLPERSNRRSDTAAQTPRSAVAGSPSDSQMSTHLAELEAKVARLTQALERVAPGVAIDSEDEDCVDELGDVEEGAVEVSQELEPSLAGEWTSVETQGLDTLLEAFEVPSMVRAMAVRAKRALKLQVEGDRVAMSTTTTMMGRTVEETETVFLVGEEFEGEQALGGPFRGISWWVDDSAEPVGEGAAGVGVDDESATGKSLTRRRALALEKHFLVEGREVVLEERIALGDADQLALTTILRAPGDCEAPVCDAGDREILANNLDATSLRFRRPLRLGDVQLLRTGRLVSCGPGTVPPQSLRDVQRMSVPGRVIVRYDDLEATTLFKREASAAPPKESSGSRRRRRGLLGMTGFLAARSDAAEAGRPNEATERLLENEACGEEPPRCLALEEGCATAGAGLASVAKEAGRVAPVAVAGCAVGAVAVAWSAGSLLLGLAGDCFTGMRQGPGPPTQGTVAAASPRAPAEGEAAEFHELVVVVDRSDGKSLGADLGRVRSGSALGAAGGVVVVKRLRDEDGLFQQWNRENPTAPVLPRDVVVEVNGFAAAEDLSGMLQQIRSRQFLRIRLRRGLDRAPPGAADVEEADCAPQASFASMSQVASVWAEDASDAGSRRSSQRPTHPPEVSDGGRPALAQVAFTDEAGSVCGRPTFSVSGGLLREATPRSGVADLGEVRQFVAATQQPSLDDGSSIGVDQRSCVSGRSGREAPAVASSERGTGGRSAFRAVDEESELSETAALAAAAVARQSDGAEPAAVRVSASRAPCGLLDPRRRSGEVVEVAEFCCFDSARLCGDGRLAMLASFADVPGGLSLSAPCDRGPPKAFRNAEAAFHALKFWALGATFSRLSGAAAHEKQLRLQQHADPTFAGYGGAWSAMLAVLGAKFSAETMAAQALLSTEDAFLLARADGAEASGSERIWSDGGDGEGGNRLGLMLLLARDGLSGRCGWTTYLQGLFDLSTGLAVSAEAGEEWQDLVRRAAGFGGPAAE